MNKIKNLQYDRWLIYKQPRQDLGLYGTSYACYSEKCFTQLGMEKPCWCSSEGHQYGGRKVTETSVIEFCY